MMIFHLNQLNPRIHLEPEVAILTLSVHEGGSLLNDSIEMSDLLYTDGVLCVLSAAVADQVGAVDPVDEFCLCLEPLHGPCKPTTQQAKRHEVDPPQNSLWNDSY